MGATRDLEIGPPDRPSKRGAFGKVPLGIVESPRPRLDDPEVQQRDRPQVAPQCDRSARLVRDRSVEQVHLLDHLRELAAPPCQRQPQSCDAHREASTASRRSALEVGLRQGQLSGRFREAPVVQLIRRVSERQVGMIG